jgi:hypothetical protein
VNLLRSLVERPIARPLRSPPIEVVLTRLFLYSRLGIALAVIWLVVTRPFSRYWLVALCAMAFAAVMLPAEMMFFLRHPLLAFAVPFAAGFVAANFGTSGMGTIAAGAVLVALAVGGYRSLDADPVTGPWLRSRVEGPCRQGLKGSIPLIRVRLAWRPATVRRSRP